MKRGLDGLRIAAALAFTVVTMAALVSFAGRNSSGTMTPANGPYVSGTTILTSDVNARFADIETEITDSLSRSGKGSMSAALRGIDGTAAAPAFSWTAELGSGLFRSAANDVRMSIGGVSRQQWMGTGTAVTGTLSATGDVTASTKLGIGGAPGTTAPLDVSAVAGNTNAKFGSAQPLYAISANATVGFNEYFSAGFKYGTAAFGGYIQLDPSGNMIFATAPSGTADTAVTNVTGLTIVNNGGGVKIGASGTAISQSNRGTASWTPAALATTGSCTNTTVTVTGAVQGSECLVGAPGIPFTVAASCAITAANTCTINLCNTSTVSATPPSGTYACRAFNP